MRIKHEELNRQDAKFAKFAKDGRERGERKREKQGEKIIQLTVNKNIIYIKYEIVFTDPHDVFDSIL